MKYWKIKSFVYLPKYSFHDINLNKLFLKPIIFLYVFSLPYDSFPYPFNIGGSLIKPLTLPLALFILPLMLYKVNVRRINKSVFLIILFCSYALVMLIFFTFTYDFHIKQTTVMIHSLKGLLSIFSLFSGIYITYFYGSRSLKKYISLIRYGYYAVLLPVMTGMFQILVIIFDSEYFMLPVRVLSSVFLSPEFALVDQQRRVMLLTFEPSVAAMQLILFIIPILVLYQSIYPKKIFPKILMGISILELVFTFSGVAILWVTAIFTLLFFMSLKNIFFKFKLNKYHSLTLVLLFFISLFSMFSLKDYFQYQYRKFDLLLTKGVLYGTDMRVGNALTGLKVFLNVNPITGVGLSMFGFFYPQYAPDFVSSYEEGRRYLDLADPMFATTKNMFVRILAETGIIGFSIFFAFIISVFNKLKTGNSIGLVRTQNVIYKVFLFSFCLLCINTDSFAHFYIWFIFALVLSHQRLNRAEVNLVSRQ